VVVHPHDDFVADLDTHLDRCLRSIDEIVSTLPESGLVVGVENLRRVGSDVVLDRVLTEFDDPRVGFCYDSSHAALHGDTFALLSRWGHRMVATHISDNGGRSDDHLLPWEGRIDWQEFARRFPRDSYAGHLGLEVETRESAFREPAAFLREARRRGERLLEMVEEGGRPAREAPPA